MMADWSNLPDDLLKLIARHLHSIKDYVRFGGVCRSWHLVTLQKDCSSCSKLPWLMLMEKENNDMRGFYCPSSERVYEILLPEIHGRRCWGSSHGWLVTVGIDMVMHLLNPLSRVQIPLPPLQKCANLNKLVCTPKEFRDIFVNKAVLFSSPSSPGCVVMAIYSQFGKMAFAKPGDEVWTPMGCRSGPFDDIIYFNGNFLAVNFEGHVVIHDLTGCHLKTVVFAPSSPVDELLYETKYLVELGGEILMVIRRLFETGITDPSNLKTWGFEVYKLDLMSKKCEEVMESLNNCGTLFLGNNCSFSICAADYPGCRKNCIYFTDDYIGLANSNPFSYDMGIYSLENRKIEPYPVRHDSVSIFSSPLWIRPSFW
ncbi:F-box protein SKIP23-like [Malania oleifera]|uniref:F-box protein SKIP23-like n=1 Tax=Malania oleifera TaxID=397392 RepID=UPI0025AE090D|nr:F-box protein SKIP23-like [Malania oleifera]